MWAYESVFYQIYPLGMTGAPFANDGRLEHRILKVKDWIPHLKKLGIGAIYFSPLFDSDTHGYNTRDFRKLDPRLGTNEDFAEVCHALHDAGIRIVLDGVFNHVGRGFGPFTDVIRNRESSPYRDWFHISFDGNTCYNDGFWYEGWEGTQDLVKLNLRNPAVTDYLLESVEGWVREFDIDGLRLDVAYMVDRDFLRLLRSRTDQLKEDFFLVGEMLHGDYKQIMNDQMCHSVTNYECYKGLYSSFNSNNLFEIVHSLMRQFGPEPWTLYRGSHLFNFADNHDVTRVASILTEPENLPLLYTLLFGMPGIPVIYYGSEWGYEAVKEPGDRSLRPAFDQPQWTSLTDHIAALARAWKENPPLQYGDFSSLLLTNRQCIIGRSYQGERIMIAINTEDSEFVAHFDAQAGRAHDLITGKSVDFGGGLRIPPRTSYVLKPY